MVLLAGMDSTHAMQLEHALYKQPLRFDVERTATEISQVSESAWYKHLPGFSSSAVVTLVSTRSEESSDVERHA